MPLTENLPLRHSNQYSADSACGHCEGVLRHEAWCVTQSVLLQYAYRAVADPNCLSLADRLILHALGAGWTTTNVR